jgi:hypothetical protein
MEAPMKIVFSELTFADARRRFEVVFTPRGLPNKPKKLKCFPDDHWPLSHTLILGAVTMPKGNYVVTG